MQSGTRVLVAGVLLLTWAWFRGQRMPTRTEWRNAAIVGALMLGANMGGVAYAEQFVASGLVVVFMAVTPALMTLANRAFGVRASWLELAGMAIGMLGVILLTMGRSISSSPAGLMALAIAALGWSIGSVLSQRVFRLAPGFVGFATQLICGGVVLMGLSLVAGESVRWPPTPLALGAWVYLVVFGSLIAFTAYMILLSRTTTTLAASYTFVNPVVGLLLGVSLGRESVTAFEWAAVGIVLLGVAALTAGRQRAGI